MKFSTVPAFALAESRASDACCTSSYFSHTPKKTFRASCAFSIRSGIAHVANAQPRAAATRAVPVRFLPAAAHAALL
eukprot:scaffold75836_cov88-Phaeocystis_antarctica.AAC.1